MGRCFWPVAVVSTLLASIQASAQSTSWENANAAGLQAYREGRYADAAGGPIAVVVERDSIAIDLEDRTIELEVPPDVLEGRGAQWKAPEPRYKTGIFAKYVKSVSSAAEGAVTSGA